MSKLHSTEFVALTFFVVLMAAGQILFKLAAKSSPLLDSLAGVRALLPNPWLWGALLLYAGATVVWIAVLQRLPLSLAYPFVALAFVIVPIAAALVFDDSLGLRYVLGSGCILAGVLLTSTA